MEKKLSIKEAFLYPVNEVFRNLKFFAVLIGSVYAVSFGLMIPLILLGIIFFATLQFFRLPEIFVFFCIGLPLIFALFLLILAVYYGLIKALLLYHDNETGIAPLSALFYCFNPIIFSLFGCAVLYGLITAGGALLLVLPGIFFWIRLQFSTFFIVDKNMSVWMAIKNSFALTRGSFWRLLIITLISDCIFNFGSGFLNAFTFNYYTNSQLYILSLPIAISTILSFLLSIITIPISLLMLVYSYRTLQKIHKID
jgi:hypothetical protein